MENLLLIITITLLIVVAAAAILFATPIRNLIKKKTTKEEYDTLLAQHPAHRVADVALARPIRPDDARYALIKDDFRPLGKAMDGYRNRAREEERSLRVSD